MNKKLRITVLTLLFVFLGLFLSCKTSGMYYQTSNSWAMQDSTDAPKKIKLRSVKTDKSGGSLTIEHEISALLPLIFLEHNFIFTNNIIEADYVLDIRATEREFFVGWNTKKSITMEVLFWPPEHVNESNDRSSAVETPLIAGRIVAEGSQGLSSSNNLQDILRRSITKAVQTEILISAKRETPESKLAVVENKGASN
ncbi:MAG: hypothetical protein Ta2G_04310 [Termitinemataceae bacterium]|nr:MAG: hypothetical protein Ta2G_04310 [Termitinemataceae bacterium]